MTNSIIENLSEQQKDIITGIFFDPRNEEATASQLKRLVNLELIKNGLLAVLMDTELEQRTWEVAE